MADVVTVNDLILEVRDQSDEYNVTAKDDDAILRMLNRGQKVITAQLARTYREPLLARTILNTTQYDKTNGIPLPRDAYEDRLIQCYVNTTDVPTLIDQRESTQVSAFEYAQSVAIPQYHYIRGRNIITVPPIQSTYNLLIDYIRQPDRLVKQLGRVSEWDATGGAWLSVEDLDTTQLSTTTDNLSSFVNVVDGLTGLVKITLQVASISATRLTFRTSPTYTSVYGRSVSTSFAALLPGPQTITADDRVCLAIGTCVPQFGLGLVNHLVQYASAELSRSLGDATTQIAESIADQAKKSAEQQAAGRKSTLRVKNRSKTWGRKGVYRPPYSGK